MYLHIICTTEIFYKVVSEGNNLISILQLERYSAFNGSHKALLKKRKFKREFLSWKIYNILNIAGREYGKVETKPNFLFLSSRVIYLSCE